MITLAAFYKDCKTDLEISLVPESTKGFNYKKALNCLKETFIKRNPQEKFLITTDKETDLKFNESEIFRSDIGTAGLMESLVRSNTHVAKSLMGKIILCGSDHLVNGDLSKFFTKDFDIGVLYRGNKINNTVVLINIQDYNRSSIINFFEQREQVYYQLPQDQKNWFGDQLSLQLIMNNHNLFHDNIPMKVSEGIYQGKNLKFKIMQYGKNEVTGCSKKSSKYNKGSIFIDFKGTRKQFFDQIYQELK